MMPFSSDIVRFLSNNSGPIKLFKVKRNRTNLMVCEEMQQTFKNWMQIYWISKSYYTLHLTCYRIHSKKGNKFWKI